MSDRAVGIFFVFLGLVLAYFAGIAHGYLATMTEAARRGCAEQVNGEWKWKDQTK